MQYRAERASDDLMVLRNQNNCEPTKEDIIAISKRTEFEYGMLQQSIKDYLNNKIPCEQPMAMGKIVSCSERLAPIVGRHFEVFFRESYGTQPSQQQINEWYTKAAIELNQNINDLKEVMNQGHEPIVVAHTQYLQMFKERYGVEPNDNNRDDISNKIGTHLDVINQLKSYSSKETERMNTIALHQVEGIHRATIDKGADLTDPERKQCLLERIDYNVRTNNSYNILHQEHLVKKEKELQNAQDIEQQKQESININRNSGMER